jgi:hypothetical protein
MTKRSVHVSRKLFRRVAITLTIAIATVSYSVVLGAFLAESLTSP